MISLSEYSVSRSCFIELACVFYRAFYIFKPKAGIYITNESIYSMDVFISKKDCKKSKMET